MGNKKGEGEINVGVCWNLRQSKERIQWMEILTNTEHCQLSISTEIYCNRIPRVQYLTGRASRSTKKLISSLLM